MGGGRAAKHALSEAHECNRMLELREQWARRDLTGANGEGKSLLRARSEIMRQWSEHKQSLIGHGAFLNPVPYQASKKRRVGARARRETLNQDVLGFT